MKAICMKDSPLMIDDVAYYTISQFSRIVGKGPARISYLVNHPEDKKHIRHLRIKGRAMIPYSEVVRFVRREGGVTTGDANAI